MLGEHALDPALADLVELALSRGWEVEILSDGLDFYIHELLGEQGIELPVMAGRLRHEDAEGVVIEMPHHNPSCGLCGTCKSGRVGELVDAGRYVIFVGDGLSDRCAAPKAQKIFAKDHLAEHLSEKRVAHEEFTTLRDVISSLFGS